MGDPPVVESSGIKAFHLYVSIASGVLVIVVTLMTQASNIMGQGTRAAMQLEEATRAQQETNRHMLEIAKKVELLSENYIRMGMRLDYLDGGGTYNRPRRKSTTPAFQGETVQ